ncbi:MAG: L-serine ammonia-lyase, iron-sulfur-dependent subunit beta [Cyanobacteria bacterium REEB65]|nr:L-serine ammonia-lyase, iron-sulfur-dependent subunit beta [Cyanobacteria bacterium REEB65]
MVGPSSSHTAGAVRLGRLAGAILGSVPKKAVVGLHGSFAETGPGHGTDKAIVAGLLGFETFDDRVKDAFEHADEAHLEYTLSPVNLGPRMHPCSAKLSLEDADGQTLEMIGSSLGGGSVVITEIDGYEVKLSGEYHTLITVHQDRPGMVREISSVLSDHGVNIAFMKLARKHRGADAFMTLEADHAIPAPCLAQLRALEGMVMVRILPLIE